MLSSAFQRSPLISTFFHTCLAIGLSIPHRNKRKTHSALLLNKRDVLRRLPLSFILWSQSPPVVLLSFPHPQCSLLLSTLLSASQGKQISCPLRFHENKRNSSMPNSFSHTIPELTWSRFINIIILSHYPFFTGFSVYKLVGCRSWISRFHLT